LTELKEILEACDTGSLTTQKKVVFLRQKMDAIDRKKAELDRIQTYLASILALMHSEEQVSAH